MTTSNIHGVTAGGIRALLAAPQAQDGFRLDWSQTIGALECTPNWDADTGDDEIREFFDEDLGDPERRADAQQQVDYWQACRADSAHTRALAQEALAAFDDGDYARACELIGDAASYERGCAAGAPVYGPIEAAFAAGRAALDSAALAIAKGRQRVAAEAVAKAEAKSIPLLLDAQDGYDVDWPTTYEVTRYGGEDVGMVRLEETLEAPGWDADTTDERIRKDIEAWSDEEGLREQALDWALQAVADCRAARDLGREALAAYRAGRFDRAYEAASEAAAIEKEYGDDQLYGDVQHELAAYGSDGYEVQEFWPPRDGRTEQAGDVWPRTVFGGSPDEALDAAIGGGLKAADYASETIVADLIVGQEIVLAVWRVDKYGERAGEEAGRRTTTLR